MAIKKNKNALFMAIIIVITLFIAYRYFDFQIRQAFLHRSNNDFPHFYFGAEVLRLGGNPYDPKMLFQAAHSQGVSRLNPFVYPTFTGLVLIPLTYVKIQTASSIWFFMNHIWLLFSFVMIFFSLKQKTEILDGQGSGEGAVRDAAQNDFFKSALLLFAAASFSIPLYRNLSAGQMNTFLLFIYSLTFYFISRKTPFCNACAGITAGFGAMFKLSPGILLLYFIIKKNHTAVLAMIFSCLIFFMISVFVFGVDVNLAYLPILKDMGYGKSTWQQYGMTFYKDPFNQGFNAFFHHIFVADSATSPWISATPDVANLLTKIVSAALILLTVLVSAIQNKKRNDLISKGLDFSLFIFLSLFVPSLMWDHYTIQLWFAFAFISMSIFKEGSSYRVEGNRCGAIAIKIIFAINIVGMNIHIPFPEFKSGAGLLLMSSKLWLALILYMLALSRLLVNNVGQCEENAPQNNKTY